MQKLGVALGHFKVQCLPALSSVCTAAQKRSGTKASAPLNISGSNGGCAILGASGPEMGPDPEGGKQDENPPSKSSTT